jgi:hypothetical protein
MDKQIWTPTDHKNTRYWTYQFDNSEHSTKIWVYHQRKDEQKFPYLFFFYENVGIDHWWHQRLRFGHDHKFEFGLFYFDPQGSGDFLAGEIITWVPHYLAYCVSSKIGVLNLEDNVKKTISEIPDDEALKLISTINSRCITLPDEKILERVGVPYSALFGRYQDPLVVDEEREAILKEYAKRAEQNKWMISMVRKEGEEEKPYKPTFNIDETFHKKEFLLRMLKRVAKYDLEREESKF